MKRNRLYLSIMAAGIGFAAVTQSCVSEEPFASGDGEGTLRMQLVVNSDLTRAQLDDDKTLGEKCIIYISGQKGLLHKFEGVDNVPEEIKLKSGSYVAEAWTGDSVTASFNKRFYRGYETFSINDDSNTQLVLKCKISNVVVSVNSATVQSDLMKNWTIKVENSRGDLTFDESNMASEKGYFMMPNCDIATDADGKYLTDESGWNYYTNLKYTIEGETAAGKPFSKTGYIAKPGVEGNLVQRAHEYRLNLEYNPKYEETGGSFVTIVVNEDEVEMPVEVGIYSRPAIKATTFDIASQLRGNEGEFGENIIKISGFTSIQNIKLTSPDYEAFGIDAMGIDLLNATQTVRDRLEEAGFTWDYQYNKERNLATSYLRFSPGYLNNLETRDDEYVMDIYVKDGNGKENTAKFRIAVGEGAIVYDDPVILDQIDDKGQPMQILGTSATISGKISDEAVAPKLMYRKADGSDNWKSVDINLTRASKEFTIELTGLEPATTYQYKAASQDWEGSAVYTFTTETPFVIPFTNMETWYEYKSYIWLPGDRWPDNFWDSGNHGSATMRKSLTTQSSDMYHSGNSSAKLLSQFVGIGNAIGKFAAGNLFVGKFDKTSSDLSGAILDFGQPYNGSHPKAMQVYAHYRPGTVSYTSNKIPEMKSGDPDQGQIFIAFATQAFHIDTSKGVYFNPNDESILGYGEADLAKGQTLGADGQLELVNIPITWYDKAKTTEAKYMIIVCSASKYGDYFVGAANSVMYVDDFELIY